MSYHCEGGKVTAPLQGLGKHPQDYFGDKDYRHHPGGQTLGRCGDRQ